LSGEHSCPAVLIACRPSGGPLKEIGVSTVASPVSRGMNGQRDPANDPPNPNSY